MGALTNAGVSAAAGGNRASSPGEAALNEQARMDARAYEPREHAATCIDGSVVGTGPLGAGLPRVDVSVEAQILGDEGPDVIKAAQTDGRGEFHVCLSRERQGVLEQALAGASPYVDHTYRLRLRFRRDGYETRLVERTITTGSRPERLDVHLDRERSALSL